MTPWGSVRSCVLAAALGFVVFLISAPQGRATDPKNASRLIGAQFHCTWSNQSDAERSEIASKLAAAGAKTVRIDVGWPSLQPTRARRLSAWHVRLADKCVDLARANGMQVLVTLLWTPEWANGGRDQATPPNRRADFAWFARATARHFRGRVAAYEIWNEPEGTRFWKGSVLRYVRLLRAAYPAIKRGDPKARVVFAGTVHNNRRWIAAAYRAGAKGAFDVMATHPYQGVGDQPPEVIGDASAWWLMTNVSTVHELMARHGDGAKPIWFTEFGWSAHGNPAGTPDYQRGVTEAVQASYIGRAYTLIRARFPYVERAFWYKDASRPGEDAHESGYGLLRADLSPRPAYWALAGLPR